jgi:hypothetical protein
MRWPFRKKTIDIRKRHRPYQQRCQCQRRHSATALLVMVIISLDGYQPIPSWERGCA